MEMRRSMEQDGERMSIIIKGMKMPKSCDNCWALDDYGDYPRCRITEEQRGYDFPIRQKRMDKCPLVEIPPHGRCIDADKLEEEPCDVVEDRDWYCVFGHSRNQIRYAPTIIEAEEEKE
jgi:hypothetical protein